MKLALTYLAAVLVVGLGATPTAAQSTSAAFPNAPLDFEQEQLIGSIREKYPELYAFASRHSQKPIAEWTQTDFNRFREQYRAFLVRRGNLYTYGSSFAAEQAAMFFRHLMLDGGGDGGD